MPNGEIEPIDGCFNIVRCIEVTDRQKLYLIAKLLGINARKAEQMAVGNVYIAQDCDPSHPAKSEGCDPRSLVIPEGGRAGASPKRAGASPKRAGAKKKK